MASQKKNKKKNKAPSIPSEAGKIYQLINGTRLRSVMWTGKDKDHLMGTIVDYEPYMRISAYVPREYVIIPGQPVKQTDSID